MDDREFELRKMEFENSISQRNFEIENFWKRAWFFGVLLLALITGYFQIVSANNRTLNEYGSCIVFVAFLVSLAQSLIIRGSKYWQERWEYKTKNRESALNIDVTKMKNFEEYEKHLIDTCILAKSENRFIRGSRFSVSKLTILVWDVLTILCCYIWFLSIHFSINGHIIWPVFIFHFVVILYLLSMWFCNGFIYQKFLKETKNTEDKKIREGQYYKKSEAYVNNKIDIPLS